MPKFIVWRLWSIYFDHHLSLKPSIGKRRKQSCTPNRCTVIRSFERGCGAGEFPLWKGNTKMGGGDVAMENVLVRKGGGGDVPGAENYVRVADDFTRQWPPNAISRRSPSLRRRGLPPGVVRRCPPPPCNPHCTLYLSCILTISYASLFSSYIIFPSASS